MVAGRRDWNSRRALSQASTPSHWRARAPHSWRAHEDAVESRERTAYSPDIRAWPCFVAHLTVCLSIGNADFGWAVARWSWGRDQVRADKEAKMATGTVKWFNPTKGYGFIQPQDGGKDVFVHISAVERAGLTSLNEGQVVEYELVSNRGKQSAENLKTR
jgi:CspA family cold shock protein